VIGKRQPYFELRVEAKDSPPTGKPMTARADVIVNVISDQNRFLMTARGIQPEQLRAHEQDIIQSMRPYTGQCTLISVEKMIENRQMADSEQTGTDVYWYAVNPNTKKICKKADFRNLFSSDASALIAGKMQPWFVLDKLTDRTAGYDVETAGDGEGFGGRWRAAPIALIVLAGVIALGALLGIIALCLFWSRYKVNRHTVHDYPSMYPVPKFGTLFLPGAPSEKIYETQMLEMPITDDDYGTKNGHLHHNGHMSNS
uniref:Uncharacterized protein n=1 Tax=Plectus sambesii TaxID=2011161 RepID=A0A914UUY5_9BILA